jgi:hypothetical protein
MVSCLKRDLSDGVFDETFGRFGGGSFRMFSFACYGYNEHLTADFADAAHVLSHAKIWSTCIGSREASEKICWKPSFWGNLKSG